VSSYKKIPIEMVSGSKLVDRVEEGGKLADIFMILVIAYF